MFAPDGAAGADRPPLPAYLAHIRQREAARAPDPDAGPEAFGRFLCWYLERYARGQDGRLVPLSRDLIDYLNAPVPDAPVPGTSRFMHWRLGPGAGAEPGAGPDKERPEPGARLDLFFRWAWQEAYLLRAEDCLVPERAVAALASPLPGQADAPWAMSAFLERLWRVSPRYRFLDPGRAGQRRLLSLCLMVQGAARPDLLRFLPGASIRAALAPGPDGATPLGAFLAELTGAPELARLSPERYAAAIRRAGFDLERRAFLTRDAAGHRHPAAARPPARGGKVDVQLIGPLRKTSGLGRAARLSALALERTGLSLNAVHCSPGDPAPDRAGGRAADGWRPARINLIHLNAESLPQALAQAPDVFNGAYNIGYFFWELDSPAACHALALELVDEIWTASRYGAEIYRPATDKPIYRPGLCCAPPGGAGRARARRYLERLCGAPGDAFTFLLSFDGFSFTQRKNPLAAIRAFALAFGPGGDGGGGENVRLIVKSHNRDRVNDPAQAGIWREIDRLVAGDGRIVALEETLSDADMRRLMQGADCYVSLHRSEGWGLGMIEAMALDVPVICTGYSGNLEFCTPQTAWLVDYRLVEVAADAYLFVRPGQRWAEPDIGHAARQMRAVYADAPARARKAAAARALIGRRFSPEAVGRRYRDRLTRILAGL